MNCRDESLTAVARQINPFTAPDCKISGLKSAHRHTPPNSIFDGPVTNLLSTLSILTEILSRAHAKGPKKALMVSNLALLLVVFRVTAWQTGH